MTRPPRCCGVPNDSENIVYVAVPRELLPRLREWSAPVLLRVAEEKDGVLSLELKAVEP